MFTNHFESYWRKMTLAALSLTFSLMLFVPKVRSQEQPMEHQGHEGMSMPMDQPADAAAQARMQAKLLSDKRESEFNHHLAGFFVVVAGVFMLFQGEFEKRWSETKYVWPASFLVSGVFLLVWSDTELWPFGHRQWLEALQNNREVLQHKTYAVLLLALGIIEWLRTSGKLKAMWSNWVFPAMAIGGSVLLLFHEHEGGMHGANHMAVMARIQSEHLGFAIAGFGIGLTKGLSETKISWRGYFARLWPLLMIVLGVLLMFYKE
jgi:putative copper resistance protein D